jgi:deazaflavin-dependent oxidoreductase (nitroreductase family)
METSVKEALDRGGIIDITTTGARTGEPRRIEIFMHNLDGTYYLTGRPGHKRDWLANLIAHPEFTVHLKRGLQADVAAVAAPVSDPERRHQVIYRARTESWGMDPEKAAGDMAFWNETAPLVSFTVGF